MKRMARRDRRPVVLDARVVTGVGGGPEKTILNSPRFLARAGYRMLCAYMHPPGDPGFEELRRRADERDAPLLSVPDRGPADWRVLVGLLNLCRRERVAVWHGHDYKSNALGLVLARFWPMRLVTTVHGWVRHTSRTPLYYRVDRFCLPRYERVLCVSPDLYDESRGCGVPEGRCVLLENGIDTEEYKRSLSSAAAKRRLGLPPERLVVGAVGRLSPEKGFDLLIRAVDRLLSGGLDVQLLIAGEGDERPRLEAVIDELGRGDRVTLLGYRSDTPLWYQAMDVFALSSHREGLPNVVLEAMALETPVVATRVAGVPRLVRDGENGLLVEAGDEAGLSEALGLLLRDAELRARLARAGRRTVETGYSFAARMEKMAALYDVLLGR
ncbi:MAG TPA: glycosyltransferase [Gemmataceae bacterium]|nr:glycosyltransferase [Gemmataceae bacterium]